MQDLERLESINIMNCNMIDVSEGGIYRRNN
jgi:hypothetical protein